MPGSSQSVADPNTVLNTAVAESLDDFASVLEQAEDFNTAVHNLIVRVLKDHKRIIFNGNGYDDAWVAQAEERGLLNLRSTTDALPYLITEENIAFYEKYKVYTRSEMVSRHEILMENYAKVLHIEAQTMLDMARREILPAVEKYQSDLCETALRKKQLSATACISVEEKLVAELSALSCSFYEKTEGLADALCTAKTLKDTVSLAKFYRETVFPVMQEMRVDADKMEEKTGKSYWPFPSYSDLLFGVR